MNAIHTLRFGRQVNNNVGIPENQEDPPFETIAKQLTNQTKFEKSKSFEVDEPPEPLIEPTPRFK